MIIKRIKSQIPVLSVFFIGLILVATLFTVSAYAIARGYTTDDPGLQTGMVVSLSTEESPSSSVERATQDNSDRVVGVVTTVENSLLTVSSGSIKILVENQGQTDAYVSDINGEVKQGDSLVISPLKGILMKSGDVPATVIGIAAGNPLTESVYHYTDDTKSKETNIAKIQINLNNLGGVEPENQLSDSALSKLGRNLVGRDVDETRILIAIFLFVMVLIVEGGIIYGAVSSAITALGRNPLAGKIIRTELLRLVIIAIAVLLIGVGAVYAVLWI